MAANRGPLNPGLFQALQSAVERGLSLNGLAGRKVKVIRAGMPNSVAYITDPSTGRIKAKLVREGEVYQVCCPTCREHRHRLNINHAWGVWDEQAKARNYHLAHCFNEGCEKLEGFTRRLEFILGGSIPTSASLILPAGSTEVEAVREPIPPGPCIRLDQLPPTHHANRFMRSRGYNPDILAPRYGLSYCVQSKFIQAQDRIIFPVTLDDKFTGWQARYVDANANGSVAGLWVCRNCGYLRTDPETKLERCSTCGSDEIRKASKYWTMPGMHTGDNLLNFDRARHFGFVVLTEGPMDVLRVASPGDPYSPGPAVCLFGHSLSPMQRKLIFETWQKGAVVVLLDADAYSEQHNIMEDLQGNFRNGVVSVMLPDDRDPGDCTHELIWKLIFDTAQRQRVDLFRSV